MSRFVYTGPPTGVTLKGKEVLLFPGQPVELPEENSFVQNLLAQGRLSPVATEEPKPANKPRKGDK